VKAGRSCALAQLIFREWRFEKLDSEIRVKDNFTDESLEIR
jgi:hypothetical protein